MTKTPLVIDLSHWNTIYKSLVPAKEAGIIAVIHKATQGISKIDEDCDARLYLAREAGLLFGTYHYLDGSDPDEQAVHYTGRCIELGISASTVFCCDHEVESVPLANAKRFLATVKSLTNRTPVIYSGSVLKAQVSRADAEISQYPLWIPHYTSAAQPTLPKGFSKYWLWQYSDNGSVPGIQSPVDVNTGNRDEIVALFEEGRIPDVPPDVPPVEPSHRTYTTVITVESDSPIHVNVVERK